MKDRYKDQDPMAGPGVLWLACVIVGFLAVALMWWWQ